MIVIELLLLVTCYLLLVTCYLLLLLLLLLNKTHVLVCHFVPPHHVSHNFSEAPNVWTSPSDVWGAFQLFP